MRTTIATLAALTLFTLPLSACGSPDRSTTPPATSTAQTTEDAEPAKVTPVSFGSAAHILEHGGGKADVTLSAPHQATPDEFAKPPADGVMWVVDVTIVAQTDVSYIGSYYYHAITSDYGAAQCDFFGPDKGALSGTAEVGAGQTRKAKIAFKIPAGATITQINLNDTFTNIGSWKG